MRLQLTLAILKPDLLANPVARSEVMDLMLHHKFYLVRSCSLHLTVAEAELFYAAHRGRFFYNRLVNHMSSGPISTHILARPDAIAHWRQLLGPTKVFRTIYTSPNSIRGRYGLTDTRNACHGSDADETARQEIRFFFPEFDVNFWYKTQEEKFIKGQVRYDKEKEEHSLI